MKRWIPLLVAILCLLFSGCDFWLKDSYVSVKPYDVQDVEPMDEVIVANSYLSVRDALENMVEECIQNAIIAIPGADENTIDYYMSAASNHIIRNNALGAYAVEEISYEIGTNAGELAIAVDIHYHYNRIDILRIKRVENISAAVAEVQSALQEYDAEITLFVSEYKETDFLQLVQDYVDENPQLCVEMPRVTASVYPDSGKDRVVVLTFTYWNSREVLRSMQKNVQEVFRQLKPGTDPVNKTVENMYAFLMDRHAYTIETSITPPYSLLHYGVGDSKAFACMFAAMCRQMGVDCRVVSGAKGGEVWYWNVYLENGDAYYVDLLRCYQEGGFYAMKQDQMSGYVWDYSAFQE